MGILVLVNTSTLKEADKNKKWAKPLDSVTLLLPYTALLFLFVFPVLDIPKFSFSRFHLIFSFWG